MGKKREHHVSRLLPAPLILTLLLAGCTVLPSEDQQNVVVMCELLDSAHVEQTDFYSLVLSTSLDTRKEVLEAHAESVKLATAISTYSYGLLEAVTVSDGANGVFTVAVDGLAGLASRMEESIVSGRDLETEVVASYVGFMGGVLALCEERGAKIKMR